MHLLNKINKGVYVIAEMSANHAGNFENALKIVHSAKESGADCLKIQTYTADTMTINCDKKYFQINGGLWDGYTLYELYKEAATPWEWQAAIKDECDAVGLDFLSTAFDQTSADFLETLGVEMYKIASFELVDIPLIRYVAKKGKPMIVSCGMASIEDIQDAVEAMLDENLPSSKIILLKCTSEYPAMIHNMNLATITDMKKRFNTEVGLSDHSIGTLAPVIAVSLGARVIEKHFCLSREIKNPDSEFSSEPHEFKAMVEAVKDANEALGSVKYSVEKDNLKFRRSIFAIKDIAIGESFTYDNIRVIRPCNGLPPKYLNEIIGKPSKSNYKYGDPIGAIEIDKRT